jgi:hypothetical protein
MPARRRMDPGRQTKGTRDAADLAWRQSRMTGDKEGPYRAVLYTIIIYDTGRIYGGVSPCENYGFYF